MSNGTPKSLEEAIANGLARASKPIQMSGTGTVAAVEVHVKDYLAHVLGTALHWAKTPSEQCVVERIGNFLGIRRGGV